MLTKRLWLAPVLISMALACGSDDDGDNGGSAGATGGSGGGATLAANCLPRCEARATECQAPASVATTECTKLCALNVTEAQAQCLEASACDVMAAAFAGGAYPCGIGTTGTGGSGGTANGGSGGSTSGGKSLGEACDCPESGDWVTCSGTDAPCEPSLTCVEFGDKKICTEACTVGSCGAGLECTELNASGVDMGDYCW